MTDLTEEERDLLIKIFVSQKEVFNVLDNVYSLDEYNYGLFWNILSDGNINGNTFTAYLLLLHYIITHAENEVSEIDAVRDIVNDAIKLNSILRDLTGHDSDLVIVLITYSKIFKPGSDMLEILKIEYAPYANILVNDNREAYRYSVRAPTMELQISYRSFDPKMNYVRRPVLKNGIKKLDKWFSKLLCTVDPDPSLAEKLSSLLDKLVTKLDE